jgi:hypothetical protein
MGLQFLKRALTVFFWDLLKRRSGRFSVAEAGGGSLAFSGAHPKLAAWRRVSVIHQFASRIAGVYPFVRKILGRGYDSALDDFPFSSPLPNLHI